MLKFRLANLKDNWYIVLSAFSFFVAQINLTKSSIAEVIVACFFWLIFLACISRSEIHETYRKAGTSLKIFSCLTACGVCLYYPRFIYEKLLHSEKIQKICAILNIPNDILYYAYLVIIICSFIFVYMFVLYFWYKLTNHINFRTLFTGSEHGELIFYSVIFLCVIFFVTRIFIKTDAFYGLKINNQDSWNIIYSSDTAYLVNNNCYLRIANGENDLRQPLFAVFSIPFMGLPYLLSRMAAVVYGHQKIFTALFMNYAQIAMLMAGIFILAKSMKLSVLQRLCFITIFCSSYVYFLFVLMMEQYIIAFSWLMLVVYVMCEDLHGDLHYDNIFLYGAGGTLITSLIITPFYVRGGGYFVKLVQQSLHSWD